ncbi:TPA: hypothetical protein OMI62_004869 [Escherichia coli]|nr:hypothetical protein [Escherichia coli]HCQ9044577.1 hypothetical protein [Escherichia coli]
MEYRSRCLFDGKAMPRKRLEGRSSEKGDRLAYTVTDAGRGALTTGSVPAAPRQPAQ